MGAHLPFPSWRLVALDVGDARIGVAVSDPSGTVVTPLRVIRRQPEDRALAEIVALVADEEAVGVVAGLPLYPSGDYSAQTHSVVDFVTRLTPLLSVPVVTADERYTTTEAERILRENNVRRDRWRDTIDAIAAQVILQDYLDSNKPASSSRYDDNDQPLAAEEIDER